MTLAAVVVIPAKDEELELGACLIAVARAIEEVDGVVEVVLVDDASDDATRAVATGCAEELGLALTVIDGPATGSGGARRAGMEHAAARLFQARNPNGLIACTDADTRVSASWLRHQLELVASGAQAIGGLIELDAEGLEPEVLRRRAARAVTRLSLVRDSSPAAEHHHFGGASMAVTARVYRAVGGLEPTVALEDETFARRLTDHGIPILRPAGVVVETSARVDGRATAGLATDLRLLEWAATRRYRADDFDIEELVRLKGTTSIAVVIPAKEVADSIAGVLHTTVGPLSDAGLVDEVLVIDASSADGTAEVAARHGATVVDENAVLTDWGPCLGKGDAMWRAIACTAADIVCFLDADTRDPAADHLLGLIGPLLIEPRISFVKGAFDRPFQSNGTDLPAEGGRVTELMARPLLNLHAPALAGFSQPLAGEMAVRRELLAELSFPAGYGIEIAMLLDVLDVVGLDGMAECHLGSRQNRHQSLRALGEMSYAVLAALEKRIHGREAMGKYVRPWDDLSVASVPVVERPPLASLAVSAARGRSRPARARVR